MEMIQSGGFKVENSLTENFSAQIHEGLVLYAASSQLRKWQFVAKNRKHSSAWSESLTKLAIVSGKKIHDKLLSRLATELFIPCRFFYFLQT